MQSKKLAGLAVIAIGGLMTAFFFGCTGPTGPAGTAGKDGKTIIDTLRDTTFANSACIVCHTTAKFDSITTEYEMSYHFTRGVVNNSSRFCERCHTSEGFKEITQDGLPYAQAAIPMATRIQCETCHKMSGFDFATDTIPCLLRTTTPVVLNYDNQFTLAGGWTTQKTTDFGEVNNLCGTCHQIRGATSFTFTDTTSIFGSDTSAHNSHKFKRPDSTALFAQTPYFPLSQYKPTDTVSYLASRTFAVHDGNQTNVFKGINAYEYPGVSYPGKDSSTWHHVNMDCSDCHILTQFSAADSTGGHTFKINRKDPACNTCHDLGSKISTDSATISGLLVELGDLLTARKVMTKKAGVSGPSAYSAQASADFYGTTYSPAAADSGVYYAATASANSVSPTTGILQYNNLIAWAKDKTYAGRIGRPWKGGELGAAYNFGFVYTANYQHEYGVHNPAYSMKVLQASIDWLNANP